MVAPTDAYKGVILNVVKNLIARSLLLKMTYE